MWGECANAEQLNCLESPHRREAGLIYNLPYDKPTADVYRHSNWNTLSHMYKLRVIKLFYKVYSDDAPHALSYLVNKSCAAYDLRRSNRIAVPRFNSYFLKNSISHRGALLWNAVCTYYTGCQFKAFYRKVKKDRHIKDLDFSSSQFSRFPDFFKILSAFRFSRIL